MCAREDNTASHRLEGLEVLKYFVFIQNFISRQIKIKQEFIYNSDPGLWKWDNTSWMHWLSDIWSYYRKLFLVWVEIFPRFDSHLSFSHQLVKHRTWVEERLVRVLLMPTWKAGLGLASIHTHKQWMVRYKFIPCLTAEKTTPPKVINLIIKWFQLVFAYVAANKVI